MAPYVHPEYTGVTLRVVWIHIVFKFVNLTEAEGSDLLLHPGLTSQTKAENTAHIKHSSDQSLSGSLIQQ